MALRHLFAALAIATSAALVAPLEAFGAPSPAAAPVVRATKVRDALKGPAREAFDRGSQLFANDDFAAARTEFERAQELSGEPRILYNVAVCEKSLHRYGKATEALERSLALGGGTLPKSYTERVNDTLATLAPFVSTLAVNVSEPGARVFVDNEELGLSPLARPLRVDVGEHVVIARKTGYLETPKQVRVTSGTPAKVDIVLEPTQRKSDVSVDANGVARARVLIDGVDVGAAPFTGVLEVGRHAITVRAPDHTSETKVVEVVYGVATRLAFSLAKEAHEARLRVITGDDRDTVSLDGRVIGKGGFFGAVLAGEHVIRVTRENAKTKTVDVVLRENETRSLDVTLDSERTGLPGWVWVIGGVAVAAAATTTAVVLGTRSPTYEGSGPGTLDPRIVLANGGIR